MSSIEAESRENELRIPSLLGHDRILVRVQASSDNVSVPLSPLPPATDVSELLLAEAPIELWWYIAVR